jgi:hypothetical protein
MSNIEVYASEVYRATPVGTALIRSLNTMISNNQMTRGAAVKILVRRMLTSIHNYMIAASRIDMMNMI